MAYIGKVPADVLIDPMVDSAAITDATIVTADLANDAVTSAKLAADSVDSSELIDGSVDNAHLAGSIAMNKTNLTAGTGLTLSTDTLSVDAAQTQITSVGTIGTGVWNGTAIASAYLDADTAHLSGSTFTGSVQISHGTTPDFTLNDTGGTTNRRVFRIAGGGDGIYFEGRNNDNSGDGDAGLIATMSLSDASTTFAGDVYVSASGSPSFRVTDTTNTVTGKFQADDSVGKVGTHTNHSFQLFSNNTTAITLDTSQKTTFAGKVQIGDSVGNSILRVRQDSSESAPCLASSAVTLSGYTAVDKYGGGIGFTWENAGADIEPAVWIGTQAESYSSHTKASLVFATRSVTSNTAPTERMRIGSDGNTIFAGDIKNSSDSKSIYVGASDDLRIVHDGSNSYIDHENTGDLKIRSRRHNGDILFYNEDSGGTETLTLQLTGASNATFAGDISMTGSQKKMVLANSSDTSSSMLRISNRSSVTPSWADEYICEIHGSGHGTNSEVLMYLKQHENDADRPILRGVNSSNHVIELGSNEQYKFRGKMSIGDAIHTPVAPLTVKAPGIDGNGLGRFESTSSSSNPEGILVYYPSNSSTSGWAFYQANSAEGKSMIHNNGDFDSRTDSYGGWSDERIKTDITDASSQWDDIKNIRMRNFKFKSAVAEYGDDAIKLLGTVAQEVELVSPALVAEVPPSKYEIENCGFGEQNEDGEWVVKKDENGKDMAVKTMKSSVLYMKAVKCLQEAMEKIETLEAKVEALENA